MEPVPQLVRLDALCARRLRATTTPVAATPATPARPTYFQGIRIAA